MTLANLASANRRVKIARLCKGESSLFWMIKAVISLLLLLLLPTFRGSLFAPLRGLSV